MQGSYLEGIADFKKICRGNLWILKTTKRILQNYDRVCIGLIGRVLGFKIRVRSRSQVCYWERQVKMALRC